MMYSMLFSVSKVSCRSLVQTMKCFSTSSLQLQPRGWKSNKINQDSNPGIQNQLANLDFEDSDLKGTDDLEEMESNFMELGQMHRLHKKEEKKHKDIVHLKLVGQKYFKPSKSPNLLTWAEKEQIRYLHNSDEEKWSIEKLAQSFPASREIITKVLKSSWQPCDSARIAKHDQRVQKHWELLQSGKLDIDSELKEHVMQFTGRTIPAHQQIPDSSVEDKWRPRPAKTEFGNIIESYKHLKGDEQEKSTGLIRRSPKELVGPNDETYVVKNEGESYMKYGSSTLDRYRERIETAVKKGHTPSPDARLMLRHSQNSSASHHIQSNETLDVAVSSSVPERQNVEIELEKDDFPPERINIPPNKWRRGATFKMGDCYYDDDGSFLYRVPGVK